MDKIKDFFHSKSYGFYVTLLAVVLSLVTLIVYTSSFGGSRYMSWAAFVIMIIGMVAGLAMPIFRLDKWVPAVLLVTNFVSFLLFVYYVYFYVSVVLVGIQATSFSSGFIASVVFFALTIVACVADVFCRQTAKTEQ